MRRVAYTDELGRLFDVLLPDGVPDSEAPLGIPVGPPELDALDLPRDIAVRLHNELYHRGLFTARDVRRRYADVLAAWQAALKVDITRLIGIYEER